MNRSGDDAGRGARLAWTTRAAADWTRAWAWFTSSATMSWVLRRSMTALDSRPRRALIRARLPNPRLSACQTSWMLKSSRPTHWLMGVKLEIRNGPHLQRGRGTFSRTRAEVPARKPAARLGPGRCRASRRYDQVEFLKDWQRRLYENGFLGMAWPKEFGGQGASQIEMAIFNEEIARVARPARSTCWGSRWPDRRSSPTARTSRRTASCPRSLICDEIWCQGFSEPNSGSDLARRARPRRAASGDEFIVNGQKVWTTLAHIADWCMLLVRTDPDAPKHRGLSYLLVDMKSPGSHGQAAAPDDRRIGIQRDVFRRRARAARQPARAASTTDGGSRPPP